mgnify:CR=1 FL=1
MIWTLTIDCTACGLYDTEYDDSEECGPAVPEMRTWGCEPPCGGVAHVECAEAQEVEV